MALMAVAPGDPVMGREGVGMALTVFRTVVNAL